MSKLILKDRPCTIRLLNTLEEKELIKRVVGAKKNRPVKKVFLTQKGKQILENNRLELTDAFYEFFENISEDEIDILEKILGKIKTNLSKNVELPI